MFLRQFKVRPEIGKPRGSRIRFGSRWPVAIVALDISGAVGDINAAIYSSAGSYTTLGSDIVLPLQWKLLGPFEAVAGMLMFGVSTALIFTVIQRLIHAQFGDTFKFLP